jgi:hypothetical protein
MRAGLIGLLLVLTGCSAIFRQRADVGGATVYQFIWEPVEAELSIRADAELGPCPRRAYTVFQKHKHDPVVVALRGCGTTAIYSRLLSNGKPARTGSWSLTSRSPVPVPPAPEPTSPGAELATYGDASAD